MNAKERIEPWIREFVRTYKERHGTETGWGEPIVGVADAEDPLFAELKEMISPTHALPSDIVPNAKSVIVYFVPFEREVVSSNTPAGNSSREWDYAYVETNRMLGDLSIHLHEKLLELGFQSSVLPPTYNYDTVKLISDWSHRSAAVIAGIGTFGINHMLITEKGCCGRVGSVITDMELEPTERPGVEYCLFKAKGTCGKCVERCAAGALTLQNGEEGYDRWKCDEELHRQLVPYPFGAVETCGKCMCGIPCSFINPVKKPAQA